jgi:HlyD family secretion protein
MKKNLNKIVVAVVMLAIISCLFCCSKNTSKQYQGYVENKLRYISCDYAGVLTSRTVQSGDEVKTGTHLFIIDQYIEQNKLDTAKENITITEAKIRQMQAQLTLADQELNRLLDLLKKKFTSQESVDVAKSTYKTALSQLEQAQSDLKNNTTNLALAQWTYDKKHVDAVADAKVFDTFHEVGEFVPAGNPVLALLVPTDTKVIFFIPEKELGKVKFGQDVTISCDGCEIGLKAKITYISPQPQFTPPVIFSQDTSSKLMFAIEARGDIATNKKLHPGQPVIVTLK